MQWVYACGDCMCSGGDCGVKKYGALAGGRSLHPMGMCSAKLDMDIRTHNTECVNMCVHACVCVSVVHTSSSLYYYSHTLPVLPPGTELPFYARLLQRPWLQQLPTFLLWIVSSATHHNTLSSILHQGEDQGLLLMGGELVSSHSSGRQVSWWAWTPGVHTNVHTIFTWPHPLPSQVEWSQPVCIHHSCAGHDASKGWCHVTDSSGLTMVPTAVEMVLPKWKHCTVLHAMYCMSVHYNTLIIAHQSPLAVLYICVYLRPHSDTVHCDPVFFIPLPSK